MISNSKDIVKTKGLHSSECQSIFKQESPIHKKESGKTINRKYGNLDGLNLSDVLK